MGEGYIYCCDKCKSKYESMIGYGLNFPMIYSELMQSIRNGYLGKEMQYISNSKKYIAVNAEKKVYLCNKCHNWDIEFVSDLYEPKNINELKKQKYEDWSGYSILDFGNPKNLSYHEKINKKKTFGELGYIPYVSNFDLKKDYKIIKRYIHKCGRCGCRTTKIKDDDIFNLPCPECGEKLRITGFVNWD